MIRSAIKPSTKKIPTRSKSHVKQLMRQADALIAELVHRGTKCEAEFADTCTPYSNLQDAHVIARSQSLTVRWAPENHLLLCRSCHMSSHNRPARWTAWLIENMPVRYLDLERRSREHFRSNVGVMEEVIKELKVKLTETP